MAGRTMLHAFDKAIARRAREIEQMTPPTDKLGERTKESKDHGNAPQSRKV